MSILSSLISSSKIINTSSNSNVLSINCSNNLTSSISIACNCNLKTIYYSAPKQTNTRAYSPTGYGYSYSYSYGYSSCVNY